jgi:hypothetical protein
MGMIIRAAACGAVFVFGFGFENTNMSVDPKPDLICELVRGNSFIWLYTTLVPTS